jgi:hypothetical protein
MSNEFILEKSMKSVRRFSILLAMTVGLLLCGTAAKADSFSFTIDLATQHAAPGDTLAFSGTVSNTGTSPIYLNGDTITITEEDDFVKDDSPFLNNFLLPLNPGDRPLDEELFSLLVKPGTPAGSYTGMFVIIGGSDGDAQDWLSAQDFTVNVTDTTIPEPSSLLLLASGMAALAGTLRRRLTC